MSFMPTKNVYWVSLYKHTNGHVVAGFPKLKKESSEREMYGTYIKLATIEVHLTNEEFAKWSLKF